MRRIRKLILKSLLGEKKRSNALDALSIKRRINNAILEILFSIPIWIVISFVCRMKRNDTLCLILSLVIATSCQHVFLCWFGLRQKKLLIRSKTIDEISDSLNIDPELLLEWAKQHSVSPSFVLKDATLYDENDFNMAKTLLRAATRPELTDGLLRPVTAPANTHSVELLRPVEAEITIAVK